MSTAIWRTIVSSGLTVAVALGAIAMSTTVTAAQGRNAAGIPIGWSAAGDHPQDYTMSVDRSTIRDGHPSARITSIASRPSGFGTLMQQIAADNFRGRRIRFSGNVMARDVSGWTALWMRVDGPANEMLGFDNAQERALHGTADWKHFEVVLDVPGNAEGIAFGALLAGGGAAWINGLNFEVVPPSVPLTGRTVVGGRKSAPVNLDFAADSH